jgi:putative addiction module component (TIGR02574 family)
VVCCHIPDPKWREQNRFASRIQKDFTMLPSVTDLETQALRLSPEDRAELADRLLTSLRSDSAIDDAWADLVDQRIAELDSGAVTAIPIEEAIARARRLIR